MRKSLALVVTLFTVCTSVAGERPQYWSDGFKAVNAQADKYLKSPGKDKNPYWHVHPSSMYKGVYLWDSAFISLIWKHKNASIAEEIIRSVLHNQQPDGRVPHVKSILGTSPWTQPPVLSWAAADILTKTQNPKFVTDIYPKLRKYHQWLWKTRRANNGLFFWAARNQFRRSLLSASASK